MCISVFLRRMYRLAAILALALAFGGDAARAGESIAGIYDAHGANPGGKRYSGVVEIVEAGQTYRVLWRIGPQTIRGIGVATPTSLAVAFGDGVVLYQRASADT